MRVEIAVAVNFLTSHLYSKLPRRRVNMLAEEISKQLRSKYQNHWHVDRPSRGSGYRCLKFNLPKIDRVIHNAAREVGLDEKEIVECLPDDLIIWIDPGEVSYRIGERGAVNILYSEDYVRTRNENPKEDPSAGARYTSEDDSGCCSSISHPGTEKTDETRRSAPRRSDTHGKDFQSSPSSEVSSLLSYGNISVPSSEYESSASYRSSPLFTTAAFAQTKFGSTKLKSSSRRHTRMLPNEFSAYIKRRSQVQEQQQYRKGTDFTFNRYPYHSDYGPQLQPAGYAWQPQATQSNSGQMTAEMSQFGTDYTYKSTRPYVRRYTYPNVFYAYEPFPLSPNPFYDRCLTGPQDVTSAGRSPPLHACVGGQQYAQPDNQQDNLLHFSQYATASYHSGKPTYRLQLMHEQLLGMSPSASSLPVGVVPRSLRSRLPAIMLRNEVHVPPPYNSSEIQRFSSATYFPPRPAVQAMYSLAGTNACGAISSTVSDPLCANNTAFHRISDGRPLSLEALPNGSHQITVINGPCFPPV